MEFKIELPVKVGDKIYTINNCKIERYYIEGIFFVEIPEISTDVSKHISLRLEKYEEPENSFKTSLPLSLCFLSKDELIKQL